jgi:hypothetical protein
VPVFGSAVFFGDLHVLHALSRLDLLLCFDIVHIELALAQDLLKHSLAVEIEADCVHHILAHPSPVLGVHCALRVSHPNYYISTNQYLLSVDCRMGGPAVIDEKVVEETDNFLECRFKVGDKEYCSSENFFQAMKATNHADH